jgi:protein TonB
MTMMPTSMSRMSQSTRGDSGAATRIIRKRRWAIGSIQSVFLLVSLTTHGAIIALLTDRHLAEAGRAKQQSEAISIELTATSVTQASLYQPDIELEASRDASMQSNPPETRQEQPEEVLTKELASEPVILSTPQSEIVANDALEIMTSTSEQAADEASQALTGQDTKSQKQNNNYIVKPEILTPRRNETTKVVKKILTEEANKKDNSTQSTRASKRSAASSGRISASKGDVVSYAARVRAQVASRRPNGNGVRGTVVISFSVSRSGALGSARISSSSGNAVIDRATLVAVRSAGPFPPPPSGAGSVSFAVPFHYR